MSRGLELSSLRMCVGDLIASKQIDCSWQFHGHEYNGSLQYSIDAMPEAGRDLYSEHLKRVGKSRENGTCHLPSSECNMSGWRREGSVALDEAKESKCMDVSKSEW